jgi:hypothetical protein
MRGFLFICNIPFTAMASSVLHRPVESATHSSHLLRRIVADVEGRQEH